MYQVDAFASSLFAGNPAAVVPLQEWLDDGLLQDIAAENNLPETVFFVPRGDRFHIRWFTPVREVELCGHATLAAAYVLYHCLGSTRASLGFDSLSGELTVTPVDGALEMNFPIEHPVPGSVDNAVFTALGGKPREVWSASYELLVFDSDAEIRHMTPDFQTLGQASSRPAIVTAPGEQEDFVCRFFAPCFGINEDPVTGSAYTILAPYWSDRLGKASLAARQVSPRGGEVACRLDGDRVRLTGRCALYLKGTLML